MKCSVKNCQKEIADHEEIKIRDQVFCKACAVLYFTCMVGGQACPMDES